VPQNPRTQVPRGAVEELHCQANTRRRPAAADDNREPWPAAAASDGSPGNNPMIDGICRIDLDRSPCRGIAAAGGQ
jgi:hypothetical protein